MGEEFGKKLNIEAKKLIKINKVKILHISICILYIGKVIILHSG